MKKFMDMIDKTQGVVNQIKKIQTRTIVPTTVVPSSNPTLQVQGFVNRLPSLFHKFKSTIERFIDRMLIMLGPKARSFLRTMVMPNYIFSGVNSLTKLAGSMSAGRFAMLFRFGGVPVAVIAVVKWIYDKSILLMETLQKDRIQAILMGTTVGGLRAFRTAFWMLPEDPLLANVMGILKGYSVSAQALQIYGTLGVQRDIDTVEGMIQVLIKAQEFLRRFPGQENQAAREFGVPLSPATLAALRDPRITPQELKRAAARELALRGRLGLTQQEEEDTVNFLNAKLILFESAKAEFLKSIANSGLADALIKISDGLTRWLKSFEAVKDKKQPGPVDPSRKDKRSDVIEDFKKQLADLDKYIQDKTRIMQDQIARFSSRAGGFAIISSAAAAGIETGGISGRVRGRAIATGRAGVSGARGGGARGARDGGPLLGQEPRISVPVNKQATVSSVVDEWRKAGMSDTGIAGLLANINEESRFNPTLRHPDQPRWGGEAHFAHGLYQEGGQEWLNYEKWLSQNYPGADWRDPRLQSQFAAWNLKTNYRNTWDAMNRGTKEQAGIAYASGYLKPAQQYLNSRINKFSRGIPDLKNYTLSPNVEVLPPIHDPNIMTVPAAPVRTFIPPDIPAGMGPTVADRLKNEGVTLPSAVDAKIRKGEQLTQGDLQSIPKDQLEKTNSLVTGMGRPPLYKDTPAPAPTTPATGTKTMLFLHGMKSRYGDKSPAEIEASARKYAAANGYKLEVMDVSGDDSQGQLAAARARLQQGGVDAVYGFSQGGYAANHLREEFPGLKYTITGAPGVDGNIALPGVKHMDLPGALAAPVPVKRGPGQWSDLPVQPGKEGRWNPGPVDPRLREIMSGAKDRFEAAHPGYTVVGSSGLRTTNDPHGRAHALDVHIRDPQGNIINPYGQDTTGLYRELAVHARREMLVRHPELQHAFNWGGFFNASGGPGIADPATGANRSDLEHFDIEGERSNRGPSMERLLKQLDNPLVKDVNIKKEESPLPSNTLDEPNLLDPTPMSTKPKEDEPKKDDPPQHPEEKHGSLTHPALKEAKINNRSDAKVDIKWNGSAGSNLSDTQTASPMRRRGTPIYDPWSKQANLLSPKSMITTPPPELDKHEEKPDPIPVNALAFTRAIGRTETDFKRSEAYSERYNQPGNNRNIGRLGSTGADYGYYQMNPKDVDFATNQLGMSRDTAQHLTGGPNHESTLEEQTGAVAEYIKLRWPTQYKDLIEKNDFHKMLEATRGTWFGLANPPKGRPADALAEFQRVRDAARVNAAAVMGGPSL
jgi:hypothetical protein